MTGSTMTNSRRLRTTDESQTMALAATIAAALRPGDVITLDGPLGSGKTCFVRGMAQGLGIDPRQVSSPTFVIQQEYAGPNGAKLTHIDGYRLSGPDELESIGWDELMDGGESIVAVEWPSRLGEALAGRVTLSAAFEHHSPTERTVTIAWAAEDSERFRKVFEHDISR